MLANTLDLILTHGLIGSRLYIGVMMLHLYMYRFCEGNFVGEMESTIGVDFYLSEIDVDGKKIKVLTHPRNTIN